LTLISKTAGDMVMGIYMKFGNIKGDATQDGFEHWINITGFEWGPAVQRDINTETGKGRNREAAQPHVANIAVTKEVDHASGPLYQSLCAVPKAQECTIAFVRTGDVGDAYLEYTLTDTLLASVDIRGDHERAHEVWKLDFTEVEVKVKPLDEHNVSQTPFSFRYNLATGKQH
jgi:type VI secretion system secreted protein Hcp